MTIACIIILICHPNLPLFNKLFMKHIWHLHNINSLFISITPSQNAACKDSSTKIEPMSFPNIKINIITMWHYYCHRPQKGWLWGSHGSCILEHSAARNSLFYDQLYSPRISWTLTLKMKKYEDSATAPGHCHCPRALPLPNIKGLHRYTDNHSILNTFWKNIYGTAPSRFNELTQCKLSQMIA